MDTHPNLPPLDELQEYLAQTEKTLAQLRRLLGTPSGAATLRTVRGSHVRSARNADAPLLSAESLQSHALEALRATLRAESQLRRNNTYGGEHVFRMSRGQLLAELASAITRFMGRNL